MTKYYVVCFFLFLGLLAKAQDDSTSVDDGDGTVKNLKGFHIGLYAGAYIANKYTAQGLYDGYGMDGNGNKNDLSHAFLPRALYTYGGFQPGTTDYIANALNVQHGNWWFDSTGQGMPINLKYTPAINVGFNGRYCFNNATAVILNANFVKLNVSGNFNLNVNTTTNGVQNTQYNLQTCSIVGSEKRMIFQLGAQQVLGDEDSQFNFFVEGGLDFIFAKYVSNQIKINNYVIDLSTYYNSSYYGNYNHKWLTNYGFGAFAGAGFNLNINSKYTIQLLYSPSFDKINIGPQPKYTFQQNAGLRAYYNF